MKISQRNLYLLLARKEMSLAQLSEKSGVSHSTLSGVNSGKSCRPQTIAKIARALDTTVESLVEGGDAS